MTFSASEKLYLYKGEEGRGAMVEGGKLPVMVRSGEGDCHWPHKATRINGVLASDSHLLIVRNISYPDGCG